MQIKTTMRYIVSLSEWVSLTNQPTPTVGKGVEKREPSCIVGGNADWGSHCGKQYGRSSKNKKMELHYDLAIPLLGIYSKKPTTLI